MALKTDYKDDILDVSQNTKRKYTMIENQDGTVSFDDETVYTQEGDSFGASDINAITEAVNNNSGMPVGTIATFDGTTLPSGFEPYQTEEQRAIAQINDNLSGFKFYPTGTQLVALVDDDSFYTDADGKYVLADSPTGQTLLADTATYKALASTEENHGEVGADTCSPFNSGLKLKFYLKSQNNEPSIAHFTISDYSKYKKLKYTLQYGTTNDRVDIFYTGGMERRNKPTTGTYSDVVIFDNYNNISSVQFVVYGSTNKLLEVSFER